ncbi:hypothetical protein [Planctomicrobium piriforme]|uniref:Uncharacterized protein n=1 Tax=Planctomicrobium piriforme TaxID=1576369 RepID=A0A1I3QVP5_9PLAN|nr:hypothetical protein [Planctomicrobium piriforme]SFJ37975.1 hypothetical protein SAMN05421753_11961 [Planctomicrobium piriforme]
MSVRITSSGILLGLVLSATGCTPGYYQPSYPTPSTVPVYPSSPQPAFPVTSIPPLPGTTPGPIVSNPGYPSIPATPTNPNSPYFPTQPSTPTVPVSTPTDNPVPIPSNPSVPATNTQPVGDITVQWAPWPLPPKNSASVAMAASPQAVTRTAQKTGHRGIHPNRFATRPGSQSERITRAKIASNAATASAENSGQDDHQIVDGANPTPMEDLHYRGGRTLQNMSFVNLYVSGEQGWNMSDVANIDRAIAAAMSDEHLNNVIRQYFNNQPIGSNALPSHPLVGYLPREISRGDVQYYLQYLYTKGYLSKYDLNNTVFNFLCPPGSLLNDEDARSGNAAVGSTTAVKTRAEEEDDEGPSPLGIGMPQDEAENDSLGGLGGYHGSIHIGSTTIYYSAEVYSESRPDGFKNGIPAFTDSWKNVVATLYHELQEARTDPDVEDVIRNPYDPSASRKLGWTSDAGEEIGDFPLHDNVSIRKIIQEVPLADGSGTVPIQIEYSNAVHGPEGPIPQLHATPAK